MPAGGLLHAIQFARHRPEPIRQASLLMVLASGVSQADVLATTLRSLATESEPPWSNKVWQLIYLMEKGYPLSRAAATVQDLLPEESIMAIRIAEESGTLEAALSGEAMRLLGQPVSPAASNVITSIATCLAVVIAMICVVGFLCVFIVPKFVEIFEGFNTELPTMTMLLIVAADELSGVGSIALLPTLAGIGGLIIIVWIIQVQLLSNGASSWLDWHARHRTPMVLRMLSLSTATGTPLNDSLQGMLAHMSPSRAATQLARVRHDLNNGAPLPDTLKSRGFISSREARFLDSAAVTRHIDWAMRHLAVAIERRRLLWLERISLITPPIMILSMGVLVWFVVTAFFLPLVKLLYSVGSLPA